MKNLMIGTKLLIAFLIVGIIPFAAIGTVSLVKSGNALKRQSFEKLEVVQQIKKVQVESYYKGCVDNISVISSNIGIGDAIKMFTLVFDENGEVNEDGYDYYTTQFGESLKRFRETYAYSDLMLINPKGRIVYSAVKGVDLGLMVSGPELAGSSLGRLFGDVENGIAIGDFETYPLDGHPTVSFILAPVTVTDSMSGKAVFAGAVAMKMGNASINATVSRRDGMGRSGDTFLVGKSGDKKTFRNDSSLAEGGAQMGKEASMGYLAEAFGGKSGSGIYEEEGRKQLVSFSPLELKGLEWVIVSKIDADEAFAEVGVLKWITGVLGIVGIIGIIGTALIVTRSIIRPIREIAGRMRDIAEGEGDLTFRLTIRGRDEIAELSGWFNTFVEKIQEMIQQVSGNANRLGTAAGELIDISGKMADGAGEASERSGNVAAASEEMSANMSSVAAASEQAAANINMVAAAAEEMTSTITEIAENSGRSRSITGDAVGQTESAAGKMAQLDLAAKEIGRVTEVITDISEQTNLLALNATIEAARAGEAGKGFAVVANEIKGLSTQTAEATSEIRQTVEKIQAAAAETTSEIHGITRVIGDVNGIVTTIAAAVEEQSATTREIAQNVTQASGGITGVNDNISQSSLASGEIAREIADLDRTAVGLSDNSSAVKGSAGDLSRLSDELNGLVNRFKI